MKIIKKCKHFFSGITAIVMILSTLSPSLITVKATDEISAKKVYGDLNEDGKINIFDLMHLKNILLNGDTNNKMLKYADVDGDGETSFKDISEMVKYLMNEIGIFEPELELDSDNDGLCDYFEQLFGTDKMNPDSDSDGLSDYEEVFITCTDPLKEDTSGDGVNDALSDNDNDGLSNIDEIKNNTDPNIADSDNDNINDGDEINLGSNPLKADSDDDNISDYGESKLGTIPSEQCSDGMTPDNKRYFEQIMDEEYLSDINTFDNCYSLTVSANMTGYIGEEIVIRESSYSNFLSNNSIYGRIIDVDYIREYEDIFDIDDFTYTLSFYLDNSLNSDDYMIFYYAEDDYILLPFETNINENILSVSYNKPATFCLVNISDSSDTFDNEIIDTTNGDEIASIGSINDGIAYQVTTEPKKIIDISYYFEVDDFHIDGWDSNPQLRDAIIDSAAQLKYDNYDLSINMIFYGEANDQYYGHGYYQVTINCNSANDIADVFDRADEFFAQNVYDTRKASTTYGDVKKNSDRPSEYHLSLSSSNMAPNLTKVNSLSFCIGKVRAPYAIRIGFMNVKVGNDDIDDYQICIKSNLSPSEKIYTIAKKQKNKLFIKSPFLGYTIVDSNIAKYISNYYSNKGIDASISNKISNKYTTAPTISDAISKNSKTMNGTVQYAQKTNVDINQIEVCYYVPWTARPGTDDSDGDGIEDYKDFDPRRSFNKQFVVAPVMQAVTSNQTAMIREQKNADDNYKQEEPTLKDYETKAKAEAIVIGGISLTTLATTSTLTIAPVLHVSTTHLQHYLSGSGDTMTDEPTSYITDTIHGPITISDNLNLVREVCEETVIDSLCFNSKEDTNLVMSDLTSSGSSSYEKEINDFSTNLASKAYNLIHTKTTTLDYTFGIGSCGGTMSFKCERNANDKFTATVYIYMLDYYNFSKSPNQILPIDDILTDGDMNRLHCCGLAKEYLYVGRLRFKMEWSRGERINKDFEGVKQVRDYLVGDLFSDLLVS